MNTELPVLVSRRPVLHRASTPDGSVVIVEVQTIELDGKRFEVDVWGFWGGVGIHHVGEPRQVLA